MNNFVGLKSNEQHSNIVLFKEMVLKIATKSVSWHINKRYLELLPLHSFANKGSAHQSTRPDR